MSLGHSARGQQEYWEPAQRACLDSAELEGEDWDSAQAADWDLTRREGSGFEPEEDWDCRPCLRVPVLVHLAQVPPPARSLAFAPCC